MKIDRKILLNPGPVTTTDSVKKAMLVPDICHREKEFGNLIKDIRCDLRKVVHADDRYSSIIFASSGTGATEATISSVIQPNKKLLVINNGLYAERIIDIAHRFNISVVSLNVPSNERPNMEAINNILTNEPDIDAIALVHHETSTGLLNPINEVGALSARHKRIFIVDAISSYAGIPINVIQDNVDYLIGTSNKCLQGMAGLSFVIANHEDLAKRSTFSKGYYFDLYKQHNALEKDNLLRFTPPVQVVYALRQALTEYFAEGEDCRFNRYKENYQVLIDGLTQLGFEFLIPRQYHSNLLVLIKFPHLQKPIQFERVHDYLYARGYTIYPSTIHIKDALRLACFGDINKQDIKKFLQELQKAIFH